MGATFILKHIYIILQFIFIFIPVRTHRLSNLFSHFTYAYQTFSQNISMPLGLANVLTWHFWITTSSFLCELKRKLNAVFITVCVLLKRSRWKKGLCVIVSRNTKSEVMKMSILFMKKFKWCVKCVYHKNIPVCWSR